MRTRPSRDLRATLRPYQETGVRWLRFLARLGLGACLADDMGLGKTLQVLALLLLLRREKAGPSLLVLPASLLANWKAEMERFTPALKATFLHPSFGSPGPSAQPSGAVRSFGDADVVLTSYGMLHRSPELESVDWTLVVLDEAQAIKNPGARQTKAVKRLRAARGSPHRDACGEPALRPVVPVRLSLSRAFLETPRDSSNS